MPFSVARLFRSPPKEPKKKPLPVDQYRQDYYKEVGGERYTCFFQGRIGAKHVFAHFETNAEFTTPNGDFLRRLPPTAEPQSTLMRCSVWREDETKTTIQFRIDEATLLYFRDGVQGGWWRPLRQVELVTGGVPEFPTHIWTGQGGVNCGWIISGGPNGKKAQRFASSYHLSESYDYCRGRPLRGGEMATLSYRLLDRAILGLSSRSRGPEDRLPSPTAGGSIPPLYGSGRSDRAEPLWLTAPRDRATAAAEPPKSKTDDAPVPPATPGAAAVSSTCEYLAWVTLDPRTGEIKAYPERISGRIEESWQKGDEFIELGAAFFNAKVYLRLKGHQPFQRTSTGKRDVRRILLRSPDEEAVLMIAGSAGSYGVADPGVTVPGIFEKRQKLDRDRLIAKDLASGGAGGSGAASSSGAPVSPSATPSPDGGPPLLSSPPVPVPAAGGRGRLMSGRGPLTRDGTPGERAPAAPAEAPPAGRRRDRVPTDPPDGIDLGLGWTHPVLDGDDSSDDGATVSF